MNFDVLEDAAPYDISDEITLYCQNCKKYMSKYIIEDCLTERGIKIPDHYFIRCADCKKSKWMVNDPFLKKLNADC